MNWKVLPHRLTVPHSDGYEAILWNLEELLSTRTQPLGLIFLFPGSLTTLILIIGVIVLLLWEIVFGILYRS